MTLASHTAPDVQFRSSTTAIRMITNAAVLQLVHDAQPELGALGLLDPDAEYLLGAIWANPKRNVDGLVADKAFVADFDPVASPLTGRISK